MDAAVTVSVGSIVAFVGFLLQVGLTIGAIAFSHGTLNQRVRSIEEKVKDQGALATSVTRLETEMESVGREIKGLREDLKLVRAELKAEMRQRAGGAAPQRSPYDHNMREWVTDE